MNSIALTQISDYLLLQSNFMPSLGLYEGRTGCVIFFYHYAQYTNINLFEDFATELLSEIIREVKYNTNVGFYSGLCGIGWAVNYLAHLRFIDIGDDYLTDLDSLLMNHDPRRINDSSMGTGLDGVLCYVKSRTATLKDGGFEPFDQTYMHDLIIGCEQLGLDIDNNSKYEFSAVLSMMMKLNPSRDYKFDWITGLKLIL